MIRLEGFRLKGEGMRVWGLRFIWGFPKIRGTILGVPIIRTIYSILGSILGSPPFWETTI